jgi:hypothetical protein
MKDSGIKIEVHLIQNFAPSNLNRDDTGQPKSATFGGFRRARVSSQCGKRAARDWWRERGTVTVGERTKRLQQLIGEKLVHDEDFNKKVPDEGDRKSGIRVFTDAYYAAADKKEPEKTSVLIFTGPGEVDVCAQAIKDLWDEDAKAATPRGKQGAETAKGIASTVEEVRDFDAKNASKKATPAAGKGEEAAKEADAKRPKKPNLIPQKEIEDRIKSAQVSGDIALFGRMLA